MGMDGKRRVNRRETMDGRMDDEKMTENDIKDMKVILGLRPRGRA